MLLDRKAVGDKLRQAHASASCAVTLVGRILRPSVYLWPWLLGISAFAALLASPQGIALAVRFHEDGYSSWTVAGLMSVTWLVVVFSTLLALVAASTREPEPDIGPQTSCVGPVVSLVIGGTWIAFLSTAYGLLFASFTTSRFVLVIVIMLGIAPVAATVLIVRSIGHRDSPAQIAFNGLRHHRIALGAIALLVAMVPLGVGATMAVYYPTGLSKVGPLLIGMVGLAATSTLFGVVLVVLPICFKRPWLGVAFAAAMSGWAVLQAPAVDEDNPLLRDAARTAYDSHRRTGLCRWAPSLESSLRLHTKEPSRRESMLDGTDRTIYLVSAEGGGIRAAYWTAVSLAQLDIAANGNFAEEVASLSGVSGGSLGIAAWLAARDREDLDSVARLDLIEEFLGSDFLSPLVGGFLFLDVPRIIFGPIWPSIRRDQVFEKALVDRWQEVGKTDFFARPLLNLCLRGFKKAPSVFFNATDALTGSYVPLTNSPLPSNDYHYSSNEGNLEMTSLANATVAQMVHISARFPYLSPPAQVGINAAVLGSQAAFRAVDEREESGQLTAEQAEAAKEEINAQDLKLRDEGLWSQIWVLVDGGYLDNTGLTPTNEALSFIEEKRQQENRHESGKPKPYSRTHVVALHISNDPGVTCLELRDDWRSRLSERARRYLEVTRRDLACGHEVLALEASLLPNPLTSLSAPLQSILAVRGEHSRQAVSKLRTHGDRASSSRAFIMEMSLGKALASAYGVQPSNDDLSAPITSTTHGYDMLTVEEMLPKLRKIAEQHVFDESVTRTAADAYLADLAKWEDAIVSAPKRAECHNEFAPLGPPLGWTLSRENQALMRCLAFRTAFSGGFSSRPLPLPPWTTSDSPAQESEPAGEVEAEQSENLPAPDGGV